jgi:hypothetical protein
MTYFNLTPFDLQEAIKFLANDLFEFGQDKCKTTISYGITGMISNIRCRVWVP